MRTIRIHVEAGLAAGTEIDLPAQAAAHVSRVLRLRVGDPVSLFNGDGNDYTAELIGVGARETRVRVLGALTNGTESPLRIVLAQALARGEKMDWIVQKATELGVTEVVPLVTARSEVKLDESRARKRLEHWQAVTVGACEQSGRARVPVIAPVQPLQSWLQSLEPNRPTTRLALLPEAELAPRNLDAPARDIVLAVGPEGGFDEADVSLLRGAGFRGLVLGPRVLRTETAGVAAIAALQALFGDG
jgi:16S rRNA (uracil1498-N3)-methyltransferase